jgi:hypothetical protein
MSAALRLIARLGGIESGLFDWMQGAVGGLKCQLVPLDVGWLAVRNR